MPLTDYIIANGHNRVGLWRISEDEDYFLRKLPLSESDKTELAAMKGARRLEWLAARYLVQVMTGWAYRLIKDAFGKPHLSTSDYEISISHSAEFTAAIISKRPIGIDIQYITPKLEQIAWRVLNETKLETLNPERQLEHLHVYWGAKESLYKAYGKGDLDFRKNILLKPFLYSNTEGVFEGVIQKEDYKAEFDIYYKKIENYILVYAVQKESTQQPPVLGLR